MSMKPFCTLKLDYCGNGYRNKDYIWLCKERVDKVFGYTEIYPSITIECFGEKVEDSVEVLINMGLDINTFYQITIDGKETYHIDESVFDLCRKFGYLDRTFYVRIIPNV